MQRSTLYPLGGAAALAACGLFATCRPTPESPPATSSSTSAAASGAGGAAATAEASASTGAPAPACEVRAPKHTSCEHDGDCWDASSCTQDVCDLGTPPSPPDPYGRRGTCRWTILADGQGCDVSDGADTCRSGVCCPPGVLPPAATPAAASLPEAR